MLTIQVETTLKCFLLEDEPLAIVQIRKYIKQWKQLQFIGFANDIEFIEELLPSISEADIIFLDLILSGGNISSLNPFLESKTTIVIISALPKEQYPVFLDQWTLYRLQKPITQEQFDQCICEILTSRFRSCN